LSACETWKVRAGSPSRIEITARDSSGSPFTFDDGTPLRASLWEGDRLAPSAVAPTIALNPDVPGAVFLALDAEASAALETGLHRWRAEAIVAGEWWLIAEGALEILDAPGADPAPPVYSSVQDLADVAEWTAGSSAAQAAAGHRAQRAAARAWLDAIVLSRIRPSAAFADLSLGAFAWAPVVGPDPYIKARLEAGALVVDADVRRACSLYAAALIAESKVAVDPKKTDPWPDRAARYRDDARRAVLTMRVALDLDADGSPDLWLHLGRVSLR